MKKLLIKEARLAASPLSFVFVAGAFITLIPQGYPLLVGSFFVTLGIFYSFINWREMNDIIYSLLLPVRKKDVVKAKFLFVSLLETAAFILQAAVTLVRMAFLSEASAGNPLMNANGLFLAFSLIVFAAYNLVFVGGFFKTSYKAGVPFIIYSVVCFLIIGVGEALHYFPGLEMLNTATFEGSGVGFIALAAAAAVFVGVTVLACKKAEKRFENTDF